MNNNDRWYRLKQIFKMILFIKTSPFMQDTLSPKIDFPVYY